MQTQNKAGKVIKANKHKQKFETLIPKRGRKLIRIQLPIFFFLYIIILHNIVVEHNTIQVNYTRTYIFLIRHNEEFLYKLKFCEKMKMSVSAAIYLNVYIFRHQYKVRR